MLKSVARVLKRAKPVPRVPNRSLLHSERHACPLPALWGKGGLSPVFVSDKVPVEKPSGDGEPTQGGAKCFSYHLSHQDTVCRLVSGTGGSPMSLSSDRLRPPVEYVSAVVFLVAALWLFKKGPPSSWVASQWLCWLFASVGFWRLLQAMDLARYRYRLKSTPPYRMKVSQLPLDHRKLFLGRGFAWHREHSQRLLEARDRLPISAGGGDPFIHGVGNGCDQPVWMDLSDRYGHTLVLGTTRVGKTRLAEMLIVQDIRRSDCVIVFDPKGDVDLLARMFYEAERCGRLHHFHFLHLGFPDLSESYNPVGSFDRVTEVAARLAAQLPSGGDASAFREFAWRFVNVVAQALFALGHKPDLQKITRHITHIEKLFLEYGMYWLEKTGDTSWQEPSPAMENNRNRSGKSPRAVSLARHLRQRGVDDPVLVGLLSAFEYDKTYFDKITASLLPLLEKLCSGPAGQLLIPKSEERQLEWRQVISEKGIVYIGLDSLSDREVAVAVGNSMLADLTSVAGYLYKRIAEGDSPGEKCGRITVHADEFNELARDEFIPLLNKAGGAGIQVTAYTQTAADMEVAVGDLARAEQMRGNMNTLIVMRVKNELTARILTEQLPKVMLYSRLAESATSDDGGLMGFSVRTADRWVSQETELLTPTDVMTLPKGQAFVLTGGGQLYKLRLPLFLPDAKEADGLSAVRRWRESQIEACL